jgi:hypothetical protein
MSSLFLFILSKPGRFVLTFFIYAFFFSILLKILPVFIDWLF